MIKEKDQLWSASHLEVKRNILLMPKSRHLTVEKRSSVVTLRGEGYLMRKIAKKLKVSLCAVQNIIRKKKETGSVKDIMYYN